MIWIAIVCMGVLGIVQYPSLRNLPVRDGLTWAVLSSMTLAMSAMIAWHINLGAHPLGWLEFLFSPPTRFLYRIL